MKKFNFFQFFTVLLILALFSVDSASGAEGKFRRARAKVVKKTKGTRASLGTAKSMVTEKIFRKKKTVTPEVSSTPGGLSTSKVTEFDFVDKDVSEEGGVERSGKGFKRPSGLRGRRLPTRRSHIPVPPPSTDVAKRGPAEEIEGVDVVKGDLTSKKTTAKELKESEARLQKMIDDMDTIIKKAPGKEPSDEDAVAFEKLSKDHSDLSGKIRSLKFKKAGETGFFKRKLKKKEKAALGLAGLGAIGGLAGTAAVSSGTAQLTGAAPVPLTGLGAGTVIYNVMTSDEESPVAAEIVDEDEEYYIPEEPEVETVLRPLDPSTSSGLEVQDDRETVEELLEEEVIEVPEVPEIIEPIEVEAEEETIALRPLDKLEAQDDREEETIEELLEEE